MSTCVSEILNFIYYKVKRCTSTKFSLITLFMAKSKLYFMLTSMFSSKMLESMESMKSLKLILFTDKWFKANLISINKLVIFSELLLIKIWHKSLKHPSIDSNIIDLYFCSRKLKIPGKTHNSPSKISTSIL